MNEIVDLYICPLCGTIVLEDEGARRSSDYIVYCPCCEYSTGDSVRMENHAEALLDKGEVLTVVTNLTIALRKYVKSNPYLEGSNV